MPETTREMLSDELVEAMENLHMYPRLIAERAAKEARRAALTELREKVEKMRDDWRIYLGAGPDETVMLDPTAVLAEIDRMLG